MRMNKIARPYDLVGYTEEQCTLWVSADAKWGLYCGDQDGIKGTVVTIFEIMGEPLVVDGPRMKETVPPFFVSRSKGCAAVLMMTLVGMMKRLPDNLHRADVARILDGLTKYGDMKKRHKVPCCLITTEKLESSKAAV